jgi:hypothetical protein
MHSPNKCEANSKMPMERSFRVNIMQDVACEQGLSESTLFNVLACKES